MRLVWLDMSENAEFSGLLQDYLTEHSSQFLETFYINNAEKKYDNSQTDPYDWQAANFLERRNSISETMNLLRERVEGHMLLLEDDIIAEPGAFYKLLEVFNYSEKFKSVCSCNYTRNSNVPDGTLLAWDFYEQKVFKDSDSCGEKTINIAPLKFEPKKGIQFIGASASGLTLYRDDFIRDYSFNARGGWGQDIMAGYDINEIDKYGADGGENKLVIRWDVKLPHIGLDKFNRFKVYRSEQCKTEVIDKDGIRF